MEYSYAKDDDMSIGTMSAILDPVSDPARESVGRILAAARGELQMDVGYLTDFFGNSQHSSQAQPNPAERDIAFMHVLERVVGEAVDRERAQKRQRERLERAIIESRARSLDSAAGLVSSEAEMVRRLALSVEYRDDETGAHIHRVSRYAAHLAVLAGLSADQCELIRHASPLHDAGKVAIPDTVLLKPGRLTPEERAIMETHAQVGYDLLRGSDSLVLQCAATLAWTHHEKYGGGGYPRGLVGESIPIEGQILAIADVYDALSSDRVYRPAFPRVKVEEMMRADSGSHFNPALLESFLTTMPDIDAPEAAHGRG